MTNDSTNTPNFSESFAENTQENLFDWTVLIVPGLRNSDENHWQSLWQSRFKQATRIHVDDWNTANLDKWQAGIRQALEQISTPVVVIAHSFGTLASVSIAAKFPEKIAALFLVAPADPDKFQIAHRLPQKKLLATTQVIASTNDPWMTEQKAESWAALWGADFLSLNNAGHINSDSGIGDWETGLVCLKKLLAKSKRIQNFSTHKAA